MLPTPRAGGHDALFDGAGEVCEQGRRLDWPATVLGPTAAWPGPLRHAVSLILAARFPMFVVWGAQRSFIYNDAYSSLLGSRHPGALGQPIRDVWPELWPEVGPLLERTFAGESTLGEDVRRTFERADGSYESTFTLTYSPLRLDDGTVGGAFCAIVETTARLNVQRRREFQLQLADRLRPLDSAAEVIAAATAMLAEHMGLSRAEYRDHIHLERTLVLSSAAHDPDWRSEGAGGLVAVPAGEPGARTHALIAFSGTPRTWTGDDVALLQEVSERVWNAVERASVAQERTSAEQRLREGMKAARMMVWEWELGTGKASFSDNAGEILGIEVKQMPDIWKSIPDQDMARMRSAYATAVESTGSYQEVVAYRHPDSGELVWLDIHGQVCTDAQGKPRSMRGVTVDVTARMRTQIELARAEASQSFQLKLTDSLRDLSDTAEIFLTTAELVGRHLGVTRVVCGDYDLERRTISYHSNYTDGGAVELLGSCPPDAFAVDDLASLEAGTPWVSGDMQRDPRTSPPEVWQMFERIGVHAAIVVPYTRNGSLVGSLFIHSGKPREWHQDEIALAEDAAGRMWTAIERVQAEEALMLADLRKDQFLAMLAHELRNPLAPISAAAELLKLPGVPAQRVATTAEVISRQVRHMTGLVDDLLDVSRVTSGMVGLDSAIVDVKHVIADAVEQVRPLIETRHHRCTVETPSGDACVNGDYKRLVQILANLLNNAAKYTPEGGTIKVTLEAQPRQVVLRVADNGMGMAADLLPHVFELFSQAERTPDRTQGGLGIGLALVRSLVELHGGSVAALSAGIGSGSEFVVRLPIAHPEPSATPSHDQPQASAQAQSSRRILLVDDNADAAQMLAMYLEACGHAVTVRNDASSALELAGEQPFDAFLLDIGLPGMDGNELARRLRAMDRTRDALLAAITGYGQQADKELAVEAGFDYFFVKPVDPGAIADILANAQRSGDATQ